MDKLLSLKEAADHMAVSEKRLEKFVKKGKLPAYKIGGSYLRFRLEDLDSLKKPISRSSYEKYLETEKPHSFFERARDFLYFNSFYFVAIVLALAMVVVILRF